MFLDNKIFGVGVKNFRNFCSKEKYYSYEACFTSTQYLYTNIIRNRNIRIFISNF